MNKLFILNAISTADYSIELREAINVIADARTLDISELSIDFLLKNEVDSVISNGLTREWYYILKALNIVSITIENIIQYYDYADIVIDFKSNNDRKYLTGKDYSIIENKDLNLLEIVDLIKILKWDSDFFGYPIAYLSCRYLTNSIAFRLEKFIKENKIKLIEYLCNCHDHNSVLVAEKNNFHFVDIRLTFEKIIKNKIDVNFPKDTSFGKAEERHIDKLKIIAKDLYKDSRYYYDKNFLEEKANIFYQNWIEKAVLGTFDDECFCFFVKDEPVGFCSIRYNKSASANIGLFGIDTNYQGLGIGKNLLFSVSNYLLDKKYYKILVVTQGRNYPAQRVYQSAGFRTKSTELWYHKWI